MKLKLTESKNCPHCGGVTFSLCEDFTRYTRVEAVGGELVSSYIDEQACDDSDARRLLCCDCGEYLELPEEL